MTKSVVILWLPVKDDRIDPETFIKKIQIEKNPPSPSLVPFLRVNLFFFFIFIGILIWVSYDESNND